MRLAHAVVAVGVLVAGCAGTTSTQRPPGSLAGATAAPGSVALPAPTGFPSAEPSATTAVVLSPASKALAFSGKTSKKTAAFMVDGTQRVDYTASGDSNFIVDLVAVDGSTQSSIANLIGSAKSSTWVYGFAGRAYLDVEADFPWKVVLTPEDPGTKSPPVQFSGTSDETTVPITLAGGETVRWRYRGSGNFIVDLVDPTTGDPADNIANLIGSSTDSTQVYDQGAFALDVTADGPWTLSISQ